MTMLARHTPQEAYRRVEMDARVNGSDARQLVSLCYEQMISALGSALHAAGHGDNRGKSAAMTRAMASLTALQLGVSGDTGVAAALRHFYESARRTLLDNVLAFDAVAVSVLRQDFINIGRATGASGTAGAAHES
ncbi:MAG: flagellar protein FliS [Novosphingobium sp.]